MAAKIVDMGMITRFFQFHRMKQRWSCRAKIRTRQMPNEEG